MATDTFLDGGGVIADWALPSAAWLRFNLGHPSAAVTVHVNGCGLRIAGQYRPLRCERLAENELRVEAAPW